jgi:hypothetical protein
MINNETVLKLTKQWIETFVLGLNLCPFARHPYKNGKIRYVVFEGVDIEHLTETLVREIAYLEQSPPSVVETSLVILKEALSDFDEYLDYLEVTEFVLNELELAGVFQIASFHPDYQFEGTEPEDAENYTNRSPFPMIHILREDSVTRAVEAYPEVGNIPEQNIATMNKLGVDKIKQMIYDIKRPH